MTETALDAAIIPVRTETGQFPKGVSGNPLGRPKNKKTRILDLRQELEIVVREHLGVERVKRIVNKVAEMAENGHIGAAKLLLDKIISNASDSDDDLSDGKTVVFRIENATFAAKAAATEPTIDVEVVEISPTPKQETNT